MPHSQEEKLRQALLKNQSGTGIKPISYSKGNHRQNPRPIQVTFHPMDQ